MLDKDKIKESLSEHDIELILRELGSQQPKYDRNGELMFQTVCHGGGKFKLYYYRDSKQFHCYTDCNSNFDIYELVIKTNKTRGIKTSFVEAVQYVASVTGKYFTAHTLATTEQSYIIDDWDWIDNFKKNKKIKITLPIFSDLVLKSFIPYPHETWLNEGISYETLEKYQIGYYMRDDRITIPHYNIDNELIGIRGRTLLQDVIDDGKKYMPLIVGNTEYYHQTSFNLYGLNFNQHAIRKIGKVMIFEGEKSVLKCADYYGENNFTVACCGSSISDWQRDMILSLGVNEVFIAFDKEFHSSVSEEAQNYAMKLIKQAHKFSPYVRTYIVWDEGGMLDFKDSPCDKGKDIFEKLMKDKYEIKSKEENIQAKIGNKK